MSDGKASGKQRWDMAAEDALLQLQELHHTHRKATRFFLMAARQGARDRKDQQPQLYKCKGCDIQGRNYERHHLCVRVYQDPGLL